MLTECPACERMVRDEKKHQVKCREYKGIERGMADVKKQRTYLMCCGENKGKGRCRSSGDKFSICMECHVLYCKKWYAIGLKEGRKK